MIRKLAAVMVCLGAIYASPPNTGNTFDEKKDGTTTTTTSAPEEPRESRGRQPGIATEESIHIVSVEDFIAADAKNGDEKLDAKNLLSSEISESKNEESKTTPVSSPKRSVAKNAAPSSVTDEFVKNADYEAGKNV